MSEGEPEAVTLAIRFANSESKIAGVAIAFARAASNSRSTDANLFKDAFLKAQGENKALFKEAIAEGAAA